MKKILVLFQNRFLLISTIIILCFILTIFILNYLSVAPHEINIKKLTFSNLLKTRESRKKQIYDYFHQVRNHALSIKSDKKMLAFFKKLKNTPNDTELEYSIDVHFVLNYGDFYDILFIDSNGFVFHSIRKESDYKKNIFESDLSTGSLSKSLKMPGDTQFVEFKYYPPSEEPAAFFTVALTDGEKHSGWFVLQFATNSVNAILTDRDGLGRTGEVYLVNNQNLMLSDSRFMEDSTILRQKVDTQAVKEAMNGNSGKKIITDYRGIEVFSSYEKFNVLGVSWIIIAEIDEDEVITEHYKKHKTYFQTEFLRYLTETPKRPSNMKKRYAPQKRVDINEYAKADKKKLLTTKGVATCTAVAIVYPGRFSYLAHISPRDDIYKTGFMENMFSRNADQNFLRELLNKIKYYDIYPYELRNLEIIIAAPHEKSFIKAVDSILAHDIELSKIKFLYNHRAFSGNVIIDPDNDSVNIEWNERQRVFVENAYSVEDLGTIIKRITGYDS